MVRIGLIVERTRGYGRLVCEGAADVVSDRPDVSVEFVESDGPAVARDRLDGVVVCVAADAVVRRLRRARVPVVAVYDKQLGVDVVDADHAAIARLAVDHFAGRHFRDFAFCGFDGVRFSDLRRDEFARRVAELHRPCLAYRTPPGAFRRFDDDVIRLERMGAPPDAAALGRWVRSLPAGTGVFCANDLRAYQLLQVCRAAGRAVPDDLAVLGVDNDQLVCNFASPRLSSVDSDPRGVGRAAMSRILEVIGEGGPPRRTLVRPLGVVERRSTECYPLDPPWLSQALVFIRARACAGISAADVFAFLDLSHTVVEEAFRKKLSTSVQREIMKRRMEEARFLLLHTELPVKDVARKSGFSGVEYFCGRFARDHGVSPSRYRASGPAENLTKPS